MTELVANSRGMVEKPMSIQFVSGEGPRVERYVIDSGEPPPQAPKE